MYCHSVRDRFRATILGLAIATTLPALAAGDSATRASAHSVVCTGNVQHPISVRVEALDPIRRGATVRFLVQSSSQVGLARAETRVVSTGSASLLSPGRVALGRVPASAERQATFRVALPMTGERNLIQFQVQGEGPMGLLTRGASFNVLPDGPTEVPVVATTGSGQKTLQVPARRIDR